MLFDRGEAAFDSERLFDGIRIGWECIRRNLWCAKHAGTKIGKERAAVLARPLADPIRDDGLAGSSKRQEDILIPELSGVTRVLDDVVSSRRSSKLRLIRCD
jgi:hypothetical protein